MSNTQVILTSHNTNLLSNRIMRPDCFFIMTQNGLTSFVNATERELREGHNLEKLYMSGEFDGGQQSENPSSGRGRENRNRDYTKFAVNKTECNTVIHQNIEKGFVLCGDTRKENIVPDSDEILSAQLNLIEKEQKVAVLCTCIYYIVEYNPKFID